MESEPTMSPRKPTVDGLDDIDDEDGILEDEVKRPNDLSLGVRRAEEAGLGGMAPSDDDDDTADNDAALGRKKER
jgi:hypothetical protein